MEGDNLVSGLIRKRAELAGEVEFLHSAVQQKMIELDHIDATIRIFRPDIDLLEIRPKAVPPRHQAVPGEMVRGVLTILRESKHPITASEIALRLMAMRSMPVADKGLVRAITKRVTACVRHHRSTGLLRSTKAPGQALVWEVA